MEQSQCVKAYLFMMAEDSSMTITIYTKENVEYRI